MIDKEKAVALRKQGLSYAKIAEELDCSEIWCKVNLKNVEKGAKESDVTKNLIRKSRTKEGVTSGEIKMALKESLPELLETTKQETNAMRRFKSKITSKEGTCVRPYWMKPTEAPKAFQLVLQAVNNLDQRLYEDVQDIMQELNLDETYIDSITRAITQLSYGGSLLSPVNIRALCQSLEETANELERRNKP